MYIGLAGLLAANAIWRGSWGALAPVAGFALLIDRLQIEAEESALLEKFGAQYEAYRAGSPRWLNRRFSTSRSPDAPRPSTLAGANPVSFHRERA